MDAQERWYRDNIELRDQRIADVGANVGRLSQFFWDASEGTSEVVSIEPVAQNVRAIEERIERSQADRWRVEHCAASSFDGELTIDVFESDETGMNSVVQPAGQPGTDTVACRTLRALVPGATVVKLDVEGHEYEILDEAVPALDTVHTWAIEFHMVPGRPLEDALALLGRHGFRVYVAGRSPDDPQGAWRSFDAPEGLTWKHIPVAKTRADGSVFKMLHVIAKR